MADQVKNSSLTKAQKTKEDEFYTELVDIENELKHYRSHFRNKIVYCNCDDPRVSNFFHYFSYNFDQLELDRLTTTCYKSQARDLFSQNEAESAIALQYDGPPPGNPIPDPDEIAVTPLNGDGDFRSPEALALLKKSDIIVTNPPFSLFRDFVSLMIEHGKDFLILGNQNAITYKEVFPLIQANKIWLGATSGDMSFRVPDYYEPRATRFWVDADGQKWRSFGNMCWFTNLDFAKRHEELTLYKPYDSIDNPEFDHYNAINVDRVNEIPKDYEGVMAVPITFLWRHNPRQFEIIDANSIRRSESVPIKPHGLIKDKDGSIDGKPKYVRVAIRRLK